MKRLFCSLLLTIFSLYTTKQNVIADEDSSARRLMTGLGPCITAPASIVSEEDVDGQFFSESDCTRNGWSFYTFAHGGETVAMTFPHDPYSCVQDGLFQVYAYGTDSSEEYRFLTPQRPAKGVNPKEVFNIVKQLLSGYPMQLIESHQYQEKGLHYLDATAYNCQQGLYLKVRMIVTPQNVLTQRTSYGPNGAHEHERFTSSLMIM